MLQYISALMLLGFALLLVALRKTYYYFPAKELKRQARSGDHLARVLYRAVAYGASLRLLLWLGIGLAVAGGFLLLSLVAPPWLAFVAVVGLIWYGFAWSPNAHVSRLGARLVMLVTPLVAWTLYYVHPLLDRVARTVDRLRPVTFHTGLFEREDLIELLESQRQLGDSRIAHEELNLALHALSFGDKTVQNFMVPRRMVKMVAENDVIGPILMDELYESGVSRFPVSAAGADSAIVGTLYLRDLVAIKHGGSVRDIMRRDASYVHEDQTLYQVLQAFLKTKHHLFIVIDSHQEFVGVITIEDVLEQITGHKLADEFDKYDDKSAVAHRHEDRQAVDRAVPAADGLDTETELTDEGHNPAP